MKIQIVFDSKYGNGKRMIEKLAGKLVGQGHEVTMNYVQETKPDKIGFGDLYIFSTPTQVFSPTRKIKKFIKKVKYPEQARYAVITTCATGNPPAIEKMEKMLDKAGLPRVAEGLMIKALEMKGPLEEYEEKLDKWIVGLKLPDTPCLEV